MVHRKLDKLMISDLKTDKIKQLFIDNHITYAALFGSIAKGDQQEDSDIDIVFDYDTSHKFSLFTMIGVQGELESLTGKKVDFIPL